MSAGSLRDVKDSAVMPRVKKKHGSEGDMFDYGESNWLQEDETDALPEILRFSAFDIFCILFSMFTYAIDLAMDLYVAYVYYDAGFIGYFVLSLVFVIIPSVTMTAFSLRWYVQDMDNQAIPKSSCTKWIVRTIFLLLQLAPVLRYFDALMYGLKSRRAAAKNDKIGQRENYASMVNEDADSTLLRLFEAFMESAPQVTLQLYILIYHYNDERGPFVNRSYKLQGFAVFTSVVSLAWSLSVYNRSLRYAQPGKKNISYKGTILQFTWHLCGISARVFALGVFAATYPVLILPVCAAHWFAMLFWLLAQKNRSCSNSCEESLFNLIVAFIYIFTFFNVKDEPTRYKYLTFYIINFLENTVLLCTWFFSFNLSTPEILMFRISGLIGDYALFFLGILCMVLYYIYFHPSVGVVSKDSLKDSTTSVPVTQTTEQKKILVRKGSIDHTHFTGAISNPQSTSSSRKNLSTAGKACTVGPSESAAKSTANNGQVTLPQNANLCTTSVLPTTNPTNDSRRVAKSTDETQL